MVSQRDLQQVVEQINQSYNRLLNKIVKLEEQVVTLESQVASNNTLSSKSKEKS
jgi:hypothetical protein